MSAIRFPVGGTVRRTSRQTIGKRREPSLETLQAGESGKRFFIFIRRNPLKRPDSEK
jgi:hypothetical protein